MKLKNVFLFSLLSAAFLFVNAQDFEKSTKVLNLGVGLGGWGTWGYNVAVPPVSASFEVGILDGIIDKASIGIGGYLGYASYKQNGSWIGDDYWTFNRLFVGARGAFHYPFIDKLDSYAGFMLGFNNYSWKWHGMNDNDVYPGSSGIGTSIFFGGRYYFSDKFAGMAEFGYGITTLNVGIALKL